MSFPEPDETESPELAMDDDGHEATEHDDTEDGAAEVEGGQVWGVALSERGADGEWEAIARPLESARFASFGLAADFAEKRNHVLIHGFDWLRAPSRAWLPVPLG